MKFTLPAVITFTLLSTLASASPHVNGNFKAIARNGIPVARNGHMGMYERQTTSSEGEGGSTSDGDTTSGEDAGTSSGEDAGDGQASAADTAAPTPTYTYDGSGGEVGDSGPALTATESGVTPTMYTLTSDTAANVEATSADPNAQPSSAPAPSSSSSSSHSGLTNYNTTTRSQSQSLVGTSAAQTTGSARASASSSQANSAALPNIMPNISPLSLITVVLAGGLGVVRVLA